MRIGGGVAHARAARHKGGRMGRTGVDTGGQGGYMAEDVWTAAGMEHARAAALHQCAAMDACRHSWAARVDVGRALGDAAGANGRIVGGAGNRVSRSAIAETGAAMQRAVDALERASAEFGLAARLSGMSAGGWDMAERAFASAGRGEWRRTARERFDEARRLEGALKEWADRSRSAACTVDESARGWVDDTADWKDGAEMDGDVGRWMETQGQMQAVADRDLKYAEEMARETDAAVRAAAEDLERITIEAGRRTAALGWVPSAAGHAESDEARRAAAALKEGMEAAVRAERGG